MNKFIPFLVRIALIAFGCPALVTSLSAQVQTGEVPKRTEIADSHHWQLADIYPDIDSWEDDFAECESGTEQLKTMKGSVGGSADALLEFLQLRDRVAVKLEQVFAYSSLLKDQDMSQSQPQAYYDRARNLEVRFAESISWFEPQLLVIPDKTLRGWMENRSELTLYGHAFDDLLRQREHVLSAREEELMAMVGKLEATPRRAFSMLTNADIEFPVLRNPKGDDVELSEARYLLFMTSPDRCFRKRAFKALLGTYLRYKNTISTTLAGSIEKDVFRARARHYDSALQAALAPDNVPVSVYRNLIATVREHLPTLHRYMEIRRAKLDIGKVHIYDTFIPLIEGEPPRIAYDDAIPIILDALQPLGEEYSALAKKAFQSRWIDVYEAQGKRSGAYSMGIYAVHPYILLNYTDTYNDVFTVAHELGHSLHSWFTQHNQPPVYGDYPIFLAEVASTCNQIILGDYLRKRAKDPAKLLFLVNSAVEDIRGTVITQTMWAEYEMRLHAEAEKGAPLTYETMSGIYRALVKEYFGPAWGHDDEVDGYWLRIPHFYHAFYVYKYATSYCAAAALAKRILAREPGALQAYLGFLKAGSSDYPIEILREAGVDLSNPEAIQATMQLFAELLKELERLLLE